MGSASRRWALNIVIRAYGDELRDEVAQTLPKIVKLVLEGSSFGRRHGVAGGRRDHRPRRHRSRLGVASFTLDELADRYPNLHLAW